MKTIHDNINDWLQREAHVVPGHAFIMDDRSCLPVWPENQVVAFVEAPQGFLVTLGSEVAYIDANSPEGIELVQTWSKFQFAELLEASAVMPSEYWYG